MGVPLVPLEIVVEAYSTFVLNVQLAPIAPLVASGVGQKRMFNL